ncbi:hypothetical protein HDV00_010967 [Rhizophlyctis rosea]|nr:hypothetical protein HDV00_010967 [Rhizophlyctis rosea]
MEFPAPKVENVEDLVAMHSQQVTAVEVGKEHFVPMDGIAEEQDHTPSTTIPATQGERSTPAPKIVADTQEPQRKMNVFSKLTTTATPSIILPPRHPILITEDSSPLRTPPSERASLGPWY